jgi:phage-related minor tail protein
MEAVSSEAKRSNQLPDLDLLDVESLKALVLAKYAEIENLNLRQQKTDAKIELVQGVINGLSVKASEVAGSVEKLADNQAKQGAGLADALAKNAALTRDLGLARGQIIDLTNKGNKMETRLEAVEKALTLIVPRPSNSDIQ